MFRVQADDLIRDEMDSTGRSSAWERECDFNTPLSEDVNLAWSKATVLGADGE